MKTEQKISMKYVFRPFFEAYLECALWSSTDAEGEPLDGDHDRSDIAFASLLSMARECIDFIRGNEAALDSYYDARSIEGAGHDFWLTRNGHGAGFWDRGLGKLGSELTDAAKVYGSCDLYVGDDGKVYAS